ncbi:MAG: ATP-binding protein [Polyangiaceae bacterium]
MTGPSVANPDATPPESPAPMPDSVLHPRFLTRVDLVRTWSRAAAAGTMSLVFIFAAYELIERRFFLSRVPVETLFAFHMARGIGASIVVGTISVGVVWWVRSRYEMAFRTAHRELALAMEKRIAEGKQLEAHLRHQEKMAALGVLSAGIAHDIANPLASMSSELEMLEGETDLHRVHESVAELRRQVSRIDRTLREMTHFARRRAEDVTSLPLHVAIDDAVRMVRHDPRARKIRIDVDVQRDLPNVRAVEDHLVMVFVNLVINAFDAMPDGGELRIEGRRDGDRTIVTVRDNGVGMDEEVRRRALEPLFTTKQGGKGTGLGLSVSAGVIEAAGGTIDIASRPGEGTLVTICFPVSGRAEVRHD